MKSPWTGTEPCADPQAEGLDPAAGGAPQTNWLGEQSEDFQARVMESRLVREVRTEQLDERARPAWRGPVKQGVLLFTIVSFLLPFVHLTGNLLSIPVGAIVGWLWHRTNAGHMRSLLIAMPVAWFYYFAVSGIFLTAILGVTLVVPCAVAFGLQREMP